MKSLLAMIVALAFASAANGAGPISGAKHRQDVAIMYQTGHLHHHSATSHYPSLYPMRLPAHKAITPKGQPQKPSQLPPIMQSNVDYPLPALGTTYEPAHHPSLPRKGFDSQGVQENIKMIQKILGR